jgi:hypothetical protein
VPKETRLRTAEEDLDSDNKGINAEASSITYNKKLDSKASDASTNPPISYNYENLFTSGLQELRTELEQKYILSNIEIVSYTLAVDINYLNSRSPNLNKKLARYLLADRNIVLREFRAVQDFTFYPLAFYPAYSNFSSLRPPAFLIDNLLAVIQENISY